MKSCDESNIFGNDSDTRRKVAVVKEVRRVQAGYQATRTPYQENAARAAARTASPVALTTGGPASDTQTRTSWFGRELKAMTGAARKEENPDGETEETEGEIKEEPTTSREADAEEVDRGRDPGNWGTQEPTREATESSHVPGGTWLSKESMVNSGDIVRSVPGAN
ncbi:hypothetical protein NDU88_009851 [Pleurodeles waltl]|uniref:Uncharacterized protein n=1 Tax=Pleurodeles waltl TaxID=8319 RepID=A0AAV7PWZ4_PLEWA|nr:hypothetical protein NDU88_009851 [Pleurodeles waltl]